MRSLGWRGLANFSSKLGDNEMLASDLAPFALGLLSRDPFGATQCLAQRVTLTVVGGPLGSLGS